MSLDRTRRVDIELISELLGVGDRGHPRPARRPGLSQPGRPPGVRPGHHRTVGQRARQTGRRDRGRRHQPRLRGLRHRAARGSAGPREAEDIKVRPGAPWIPAAVIAAFAEKPSASPSVNAEHIGGRWTVECANYKRHGRLMTDEWGRPTQLRRHEPARSGLQLQSHRHHPRGSVELLDAQATFAAQAKCAKITEEFGRWLWSDDERRDTARRRIQPPLQLPARTPLRRRRHLRLPGLSDHFTPHPYQRNAVARIINEPAALLDHVVGAGKTGTMLMAAMELRRLGWSRQPWIVVPNHIIEQVGREAKQWYPAANVLLGVGRDRPPTVAAGWSPNARPADWDMVIVPQSAFTAIACQRRRQHPPTSTTSSTTLREQLRTAKTDAAKKRLELAEQEGPRPTGRTHRAAPTKTPACGSNKPGVTTCASTRPSCTRTNSSLAISRSCPARPRRGAPRTSP